jgi:hypothetical protein
MNSVSTPEPDADAQRQQPFLGCDGQLAERDLHAFGQRVELPIADLVGTVVYVPHGGSAVLVTWSHSSRSQRDPTRREDRHLKFYELRDNLEPRPRARNMRRVAERGRLG